MDDLFFNLVLLLGHEILIMTQEYFPEEYVYIMSSPNVAKCHDFLCKMSVVWVASLR